MDPIEAAAIEGAEAVDGIFTKQDVISRYSDAQAVEDGMLVALNRKDRATAAVFGYLKDSRSRCLKSAPPSCWPVPMLDFFSAKTPEAEAVALLRGLVDSQRAEAARVWLVDGILCAVMVESAPGGRVCALEMARGVQAEAGRPVAWLVPNENGGVTVMFPEDY